MMDDFSQRLALKQKIISGKPVLGLFIKTPSAHVVELLENSGVDFLVFDAEHGPFSIDALDHCILAARSVGIQSLVRVDCIESSLIQTVLDMGASGIIVPHIRTPDDARCAVASSRYFGGSRGFSASHRAARYGQMSLDAYRKSSDESVIVIGQIEDSIALDFVGKISTVEGIDALFVGRADLAISRGLTDVNSKTIQNDVNTIYEKCIQADRRIGLFLSSLQSVKEQQMKGVSVFFIGSDQSLLQSAAAQLAEEFINRTS